MLILTALNTLLFLQCCQWCSSIRVPVVWENEEPSGNSDKVSASDNSDAENDKQLSETESEFPINSYDPYNVNVYSAPIVQKPQIPVYYFKYPANKPQFAIDVASYHGVDSPAKLYSASPISPYTGQKKPDLGKHYIDGKDLFSFEPFQRYTDNQGSQNIKVEPTTSSYEIYHPYKAEEPALKDLYKDPVLLKIRNDILSNKNRLQNYEKEAEQSNVSSDDYTKSSEDIDKERFPIKNYPAEYEIHKPQRRPIYYTPPQKFSRNHYLNRRFKHPLNQPYIKIRPMHYHPLQKQIQGLRYYHGKKYDDERNEYPQVAPVEKIVQPSEGYDIFERGQEKYTHLRNNVDNDINKAVLQNRPSLYQSLELQNNDETSENDSGSEEFIPIKSYAQVRKTESTKHLPRDAAFEEATNSEEIKNAPRLKQAVKSTKAQTVYSEEGYEDSAYDHAGEQKHASDHEGHGGFLKQNETSAGKFKTPSFTASYEDGSGSEYGHDIEHGEKWQDDDKDAQKEKDNNHTNEDEYDEIKESEESDKYNDSAVNDTSQHEVNKREAGFKVPETNLNNTYLTEDEITKILKRQKQKKTKKKNFKYPYYNKRYSKLNKNSPLHYAENLKFIPKKTRGGTEFYDSTSNLECEEVDTEVDPIPETVKEAERNNANNSNATSSRRKRQANFDQIKEKPRLGGLGDKIDCFKVKYFGRNPLDSPFFKEELITDTDPIFIPKSAAYKLKKPLDTSPAESNSNVFIIGTQLTENGTKDINDFIERIRIGGHHMQKKSQEPIKSIPLGTTVTENEGNIKYSIEQTSNVYDDIEGIKNKSILGGFGINNNKSKINIGNIDITQTKDLNLDNNSDTTIQKGLRVKRSTSFVYEPYKVVRDNNANDSKKTTTSTNVSSLIKQLQSSRVSDVIPVNTEDKKKKEKLQPVKRNIQTRQYKHIGKDDRLKNATNEEAQHSVVDVSTDKRRGEPRYEIVPSNHKRTYKPVKNKNSMSIEDFKTHIENKQNIKDENTHLRNETFSEAGNNRHILKAIQTTRRPYFDVSQFLPKQIDVQAPMASRKIHKVVKNPTVNNKRNPNDDEQSDNEDYSEESDEDDVTVTTTEKSPKYDRNGKKTHNPKESDSHDDTNSSQVQPKLRLVTRFREPNKKKVLNNDYEDEEDNPKYAEKTKKSSKSTLVTDSKTYGVGDDDMKKDEIDAMIGSQHNMKEYIPEYEKEKNKDRDDDDTEVSDSEEQSDSDNEDYYDEEDEEENDDDEENSDDNEEEYDEEEEEDTNKSNEDSPQITTEQTEIGSENQILPIILKKKIEIHKELPMNKSLPHTTQYKQDIIEEETIKKSPKRKVLELYKDGRLAKEVNKLADVEVFKDELQVNTKPRHGGNYKRLDDHLKYRNIKEVPEKESREKNDTKLYQELKSKPIKDNPSRSRNNANLKINNSRGKNIHTEIQTSTERVLKHKDGEEKKKDFRRISHKQQSENASSPESRSEDADRNINTYNKDRVTRRRLPTRRRKERVEIDNVEEESKAMHGGNLKSLAESGNSRRFIAADVLNSFAQAVPILTTTPHYILDPSKRMYYYLDT